MYAATNERSVPLFLSANDSNRQAFVRIINHSSTAGEIRIFAFDDAGNRQGPSTLSLQAYGNQHFNSDDLAFGNPQKGLVGAMESGEGDWRLQMETDLDIEVMAYVRTRDGFLSSLNDVVPAQGFCWRVPIFNPGSNANQRSLLRLINPTDGELSVEIVGLDDSRASPGSTVTLQLPAQSARTLTAAALESGQDGFTGALGDGVGKWQLAVTADGPISLMNLLESPTQHLTNLSRPALHSEGRCWAATDLTGADRSIEKYLTQKIENDVSPGMIAAIIDSGGIRAIAASGVRKADDSQPFLETDAVHMGSMTKAMTSTMLATLVADGTFARGWDTTVSEVFSELLDQIHVDVHTVTLWQLVSMTSGLKRNAESYSTYRHLDIIEQRYNILRDNLADRPVAAVGEYHYSNLAYVVAGAMAEKLTGKSWETLMRERVFQPLGISSAGFGPPGTLGEVDQPWGHRRDSGTRHWTPSQNDNAPALGPAGTVHMTILDWARLAALWLTAKPPLILDQEKLDQLISPVSGTYAAGWSAVERSWANGVAVSHTGSNTWWYALGWIAPAIDRAYFVAANAAEADLDETSAKLDEVVIDLIHHRPGLANSSLDDHPLENN
ncbi:MAG: serine hydrolase [Rhodospirillaceae bacterium]|nr:serine hydrolase [Rhodospirillaceae bacterium]